MSQGNVKERKEDSEEIETLNGKMNFVIKEMEDGKGQYTASWEYKNVAYTLSGEITERRINKNFRKNCI